MKKKLSKNPSIMNHSNPFLCDSFDQFNDQWFRSR